VSGADLVEAPAFMPRATGRGERRQAFVEAASEGIVSS